MKKILLLVLFACSQSLFSQRKVDTEYSGFFDSYYFRGPLNFTLGGGVAAYSGDIEGVKPSYTMGLGASYKVWPRTYFGAQFNVLNLRADDRDTTRNISFNNNMMEFYTFCRFNIFDRKMLKNMDVKRKEMTFRPYLLLGIGLNRYNVVSTTTNPAWEKSAIPEDVRYPKLGVFIPAGLGFAFFITHRISILTEFTVRYPFTDYIDDVSARGNSKNDVYYTGELKIQYSPFGFKRKKKHKFSEPPPYGGKVGGEKPAGNTEDKPEGTPENQTPEQPTPDTEKPADGTQPENQGDDGWGNPQPAPENDKPQNDDPFKEQPK